MLYRLIMWCWRAWPVYIILLLLGIHSLLIFYLSWEPCTTNKTISLFTQILGGVIVVYMINSNIGIISNKNLRKILSDYIRNCPLFKRNIVLEAEEGSIGVTGGNVEFSIIRHPKSIEEEITYLQEQIEWVKRELKQKIVDVNEKIDRNSRETKSENQKYSVAVNNIESKLGKFSLGSLKIQLFGVLLMIYGAISGYLA